MIALICRVGADGNKIITTKHFDKKTDYNKFIADTYLWKAPREFNPEVYQRTINVSGMKADRVFKTFPITTVIYIST